MGFGPTYWVFIALPIGWQGVGAMWFERTFYGLFCDLDLDLLADDPSKDLMVLRHVFGITSTKSWHVQGKHHVKLKGIYSIFGVSKCEKGGYTCSKEPRTIVAYVYLYIKYIDVYVYILYILYILYIHQYILYIKKGKVYKKR